MYSTELKKKKKKNMMMERFIHSFIQHIKDTNVLTTTTATTTSLAESQIVTDRQTDRQHIYLQLAEIICTLYSDGYG
jgi:uncharacterized protein YgbK (DUF1537 family)